MMTKSTAGLLLDLLNQTRVGPLEADAEARWALIISARNEAIVALNTPDVPVEVPVQTETAPEADDKVVHLSKSNGKKLGVDKVEALASPE